MLWAFIGRMPGLFLYAYIGTLGQLAVRIMRGKSYPQTIEYWIWGGAFIMTVLLLIVLGRVARRAIQTPLKPRSGRLPKDRVEHSVFP
jgi:uncharacterized membrane protein YdjX (TVP38/TMEM64 family)